MYFIDLGEKVVDATSFAENVTAVWTRHSPLIALTKKLNKINPEPRSN